MYILALLPTVCASFSVFHKVCFNNLHTHSPCREFTLLLKHAIKERIGDSFGEPNLLTRLCVQQ